MTKVIEWLAEETQQKALATTKLVLAVRGLVQKEIASDAVVRAQQMRESIAGVVVNDESEAQAVVDAVRTMTEAEKGLRIRLREIVALPTAMGKAAKEEAAAVLFELTQGIEYGKQANQAFMARQRREAEAAAEKARKEAEEAAAEVAAELDEDEDVPPAMEVPEPEPAKKIAGGSGIMYETKVLKCELHNPNDVPPEWLKLVEAPAKEAFRREVRREDIAEPQGEESVVFNGVRFWYQRSMATRADYAK